MKFPRALSVGVSAIALLLASSAVAQAPGSGQVKHVLLISVDGMHAVDFLNCANGIGTVNGGQPYCPAITALGKTGINYVDANTSKPSDSFPGLTAIVTGGSPALTGVYLRCRLFPQPRRTGCRDGQWKRARPLHSGRGADRFYDRV